MSQLNPLYSFAVFPSHSCSLSFENIIDPHSPALDHRILRKFLFICCGKSQSCAAFDSLVTSLRCDEALALYYEDVIPKVDYQQHCSRNIGRYFKMETVKLWLWADEISISH